MDVGRDHHGWSMAAYAGEASTSAGQANYSRAQGELA
jgi:hypothetical protein